MRVCAHLEPLPLPQNLLGITIAMSANAVIPFALNVQKWVHEHNEGPDGKPKKHFTKIPLWWVGIVCMIGGEFFNMLAYGKLTLNLALSHNP